MHTKPPKPITLRAKWAAGRFVAIPPRASAAGRMKRVKNAERRNTICQRSRRWLTSFKPAACNAKKKLPARMKIAPRPFGDSDNQNLWMTGLLVRMAQAGYKAPATIALQQCPARARHVTSPPSSGPHPRLHQERLHRAHDRRARRVPRPVERAADRRLLPGDAGAGAAGRHLGVRLRIADLEPVRARGRDEARAAQRLSPALLPLDASGTRLARVPGPDV